MLNIVMLVVGLVTGLAISWALMRKRIGELEETNRKRVVEDKELLEKAREEAREIVDHARSQAAKEAEGVALDTEAKVKTAEARVTQAEAQIKTAEVQAKELLLRAREEADAEARRAAEQTSKRLKEQEDRQTKRDQLQREKEDLLSSRELDLARKEKGLQSREQQLVTKEASVNDIVQSQQAKLQQIAGLTADEARAQLVDQFKDEARRSAANEAKHIEDAAREEAEKRSKRIVGIAIQRYAGEHTQERSVTSVPIPNDELKGRIIGREGRNIRALQEATGVDFIVDDTPETIVVSSFDPIRREVARIALEKLVLDGRIHPTRIEEVVTKAQDEVERAMREAAEQAMMELQITRVHPELVKLLGRLRYRYSYAQNVLRHSVECGFLAGLMAGELGLNVRQARRAGLLHDIGKAVSHEQEGGHAVVGGQLCRKHGEDEVVSNAVACHHDDEPCRSILGHLVAAADTLSGARPGARREMLESYVRRLEDLERISASFKGVERAFAIQAGREVRVLVEPSEVSDAESALLAREISKKIEDSMTYPGQIRVTVVRETRAIDYAK